MRQKRWEAENASSTASKADVPTTTQGPVLRSSKGSETTELVVNHSHVVNFGILANMLKSCSSCSKGPLDLANIEQVRSQGVCAVLNIRCIHCNVINIIRPAETHQRGKRGPPAFDANTRAGLATVHTGIGHTHYKSLMSTLGLPSLTDKNFKKKERESGLAIEQVAQASCDKHTAEEREMSRSSPEEEVVKVGVSYDMGWRKRGKKYDSSSGVGAAIGLKTGKVLNYATRNTMCRVCQQAEHDTTQVRPHDCRKNHQGSSKSMEANAAVQVFTEATSKGVTYSTYVGDDDSSTECRLNTLVTYDIEKWSDINHICRTLGSRLYTAKSKVKGLTAPVIAYIQKCFKYCLRQNKGNPSSLKSALSQIVPHAFGDHDECKEWCAYKKDPTTYRHRDLPGGKDLTGEDLRAALEDALLPFLNEEAAKKMAPCGSSQRNECLNSVIGSKAPKIRHYGGSESADFRTAAAIAQFNEGTSYVAQAAEVMGLAPSSTTSQYIESAERKKVKDRQRQSTKRFKTTRANRRKKKTQQTSSLEAKEGVTYETGIALTRAGNTLTSGTLLDLRTSITREEYQLYTNDLEQQGQQEEQSHTEQVKYIMFDVETTGLDRESEIIQLCTTVEDKPFQQYLLPERRSISESATKVHGLTISYKNGKKALVKEGAVLPATSQAQGLADFVEYVREQNAESIVLVAHNGNRFDFPLLFNSLRRYNLLELFLTCNITLVDSLQVLCQEMKCKDSPLNSCTSKTLSGLYEFLFNEQFKAHDAQEDVSALSRILFKSVLNLSTDTLLSSSVSGEMFVHQMKSNLTAKARKSTLQNLPVSDGMKEKLGRAGLDMKKLKEKFTVGGTKALLTVLALPASFDEIANKGSKPRVTKDIRILTSIVSFLQ